VQCDNSRAPEWRQWATALSLSCEFVSVSCSFIATKMLRERERL